MGFPLLDKAMDGLRPGFHMLAAESNMGKSNFTAHMLYNVLSLNNNAAVLDFSFDDPYIDRLGRIAAAGSGVSINVVRRPNKYKYREKKHAAEDRRNLILRYEALEWLKRETHRYWTFDASNHSTDITKIRETIEHALVTIKHDARRTGEEPRQLVVFLDSFHDICADAILGLNAPSIQQYDYLAQAFADMVSELEIPVFTTGELRKLNAVRRPTEHDVRDTVKIRYKLTTLLLGYNDVGVRREAATVYYERQKRKAKQPIFEIDVAKNKNTSVKTRIFYRTEPERSRYFELSQKEADEINEIIYNGG